jgi:hypothetical protein
MSHVPEILDFLHSTKSAYIELVIISSLGSHHALYRLQMQTGVHVVAHCAANDLLLKVNDPDDPSKKSPMALSKSSAENLMYLSGCLPVSKKLPYRPMLSVLYEPPQMLH